MTSHDVSADLSELRKTLDSVEVVLDLPNLRREETELEAAAADPELWDDPAHAQKVTSRLSHVQTQLRRINDLHARLDDIEVLSELAVAEDDPSSAAEADGELAAVRKAIDDLEVQTLLSGEYDERNAVISVRSGAGGADACDFAEQLMRMYLRWAEAHDYGTEVYDVSYAEEAGIRSATFAVSGPYAYGTLSVEQGTHRVVRISKYDNQGRRQTGFAAVEVVPMVEQTDDIDIPNEDLRIDVFRASGPGGQGVNTTDSAVRITHTPTGIAVACQNERSQLQNRATAMSILRAKLLQITRDEEKAKIDSLRGSVTASWGDQMRSYVQHPYQMVKDLRTGYETGDVQGVYDGNIDGFLEAGIRWRKSKDNQDGS
ncbi:peptide chain release factor 2 [Haloglycomyces albus]|uniref:peptide chain release factor 2 n=1 Tax=Haloglycomyces albus TaxID=526067 RepID=UPI00046D33D3|nr:peptide chain release factor 2 [Haloglycomyces albus]